MLYFSCLTKFCYPIRISNSRSTKNSYRLFLIFFPSPLEKFDPYEPYITFSIRSSGEKNIIKMF